MAIDLNRSFSGRPKNVALQERAVAEAQRKLNQIEKMRAQMAKQVELEVERLNQMRDEQILFTEGNKAGTTPPLSASTPTAFASQFEQFRGLQANKVVGVSGVPERPPPETLKPISNGGPAAGPVDFTGHLTPQSNDTPVFRTSDNDQHWDTLTTDPGKTVYISGYYKSSGSDTKQYEYILGSTHLPLSVGDMIQVPVHSKGHNDGRFLEGHDRRFVVTDIYSREKFHPYHDVAW